MGRLQSFFPAHTNCNIDARHLEFAPNYGAEERIADKARLQKFRAIWALMIFSVLLYYAWPYFIDLVEAYREAELQLWLEENDIPRSN